MLCLIKMLYKNNNHESDSYFYNFYEVINEGKINLCLDGKSCSVSGKEIVQTVKYLKTDNRRRNFV